MKHNQFYKSPSDAEPNWDYQGKRKDQLEISPLIIWLMILAVFVAIVFAMIHRPAIKTMHVSPIDTFSNHSQLEPLKK